MVSVLGLMASALSFGALGSDFASVFNHRARSFGDCCCLEMSEMLFHVKTMFWVSFTDLEALGIVLGVKDKPSGLSPINLIKI